MRTAISLLFSLVIIISSPYAAASAKLKANWQHVELSFYNLVAAQKGLKTTFPNLYVFNTKNQVTAMTLQANTGLFKGLDLDKLPTRALPNSNNITARVKLIKPLIKQQDKFTLVMVVPDKNVVDCEACREALNHLDEVLAEHSKDDIALLLITVVRK